MSVSADTSFAPTSGLDVVVSVLSIAIVVGAATCTVALSRCAAIGSEFSVHLRSVCGDASECECGGEVGIDTCVDTDVDG